MDLAATKKDIQSEMINRIVTREEWLTARREHLVKEKELTRQLDQLRVERRALPWVKVDKNYVFDGLNGKQTLSDLFQGRSQLIVQHFMFSPSWKEGCVGCSFGADHSDIARKHFENRDVSFVAVSRAQMNQIEKFRKRMGWEFLWVSSYDNDFNYDYNVSFREEEREGGKVYYNFTEIDSSEEELPGISVFYKNEKGEIFHTYSTYARGMEMLVSTFMFMDLTPKGRNEHGPDGTQVDWIRHHDKYANGQNNNLLGKAVDASLDSGCGCGIGE